ncbi:MAG: outer membrane beta-barrel protein [Saprospiraceae bacterium]|nr:outer membrane beta-barrel protein [Saprospiraceae bacterium]
MSDNILYVGGGIGFTTQSSKITERVVNQVLESETPSVNIFEATVGLGYFINEKISLNLDFQYGTGSLIQDSDVNGDYEKVNVNIYSINPYMRYLLMLEENKFGFTFDTGLEYGKTTRSVEEKVGNQIFKEDLPSTTNLSIGIRPGIIYFPNEKVGLEASFGFIGYYSETTKEIIDADSDVTEKINGFTFGANSLNPSLQFGFRYYFQR